MNTLKYCEKYFALYLLNSFLYPTVRLIKVDKEKKKREFGKNDKARIIEEIKLL